MLSSGIAVYASGFKRRSLLLLMLFYYICLMFVFVTLSRLFFAKESWERSASWLSCVFCFLGYFHVPIWCLRSGMVPNCIDSLYLPYILLYLHWNSCYLFK